MRFPFFKVFVDDFIGGTVAMTTEEVGAYWLLLCYQWGKGSIPSDHVLIRRIARLSENFDLTFVLTKFTETPEGLKNLRLEKERESVMAFFDKQTANGRRGGRPKNPKKPMGFQNGDCNDSDLGGSNVENAENSETQKKPSIAIAIAITRSKAKATASTGTCAFDRFWEAYPKKKAKGDAEKVWKRLKLDSKIEDMLKAIEQQKNSEDWRQEGGRFIPHPATWLNGARWHDETTPHGTDTKTTRSGNGRVTGADQRQLGLPEPAGESLSELLRRKGESGKQMATDVPLT